ncbi:hypothetical protein Tco_0344721 [Tanacetum coccineum]
MMKQGYMVLTYGSDLLTMNEILSFRVSAKASRSFKTDRLTAANANGILKLSNGCTGYSLKDKNKVKPDKTESGIGKSAKTRGQRYKRIKNGAKADISGSTRQHPLEEHERCQQSICKRCWSGLSKGFCHICNEYSSIDDSNPNSFIDSPKVFNLPPRPLTYSIESLNANPNIDNTPQEQSSHYQDPSENFAQNFSQSPPQINQNFRYGCGDSLDDFFCQRCTCEFCGNGAHYGYDCPPQVPFVYNQDPCFNQNYDNFPQTSPSFQQQYICCTCCRGTHETCQCDQFVFDEPYCANCGGLHETFQCQPINQNYYEPNPCYDSSYFGFDKIKPLQFPVIHQPPQEMSIQDIEDLKQQYLDEMKTLINEKDYRSGRIDIEIKINELKENFNEMSIEINKKKKLQQLEQVANLSTYPSRHFNSFCYDDDDDEEYTIAITPEKPVDSLIMEDEHLDTIPETESDEFIKSSVENLVPTPSESEDFSDIESECDVPDCDDSQTTNFSTFSNPLFDDSTSSDDESSHEEIDPHHFNAESDLIESLLNQDTSIVSSLKFDSLLEEFSGELIHINLISPENDEADSDPEEEIRLVEKLLYDNSSPRPPEELNSKNSDVVIAIFLTFISREDSDSLMEEIDIFLAPDESIPPGIENDDYDLEGDILFLEELLSNDSLSLPENESFHFKRYYDPSPPRPPAKLPDDDGIHFDIEPNTGILTAKVMDDISKHCVLMPSILPTHPTRCPVIDTLLPFSSENEIAPDYEDSRAHGFVLRSLELQSLT